MAIALKPGLRLKNDSIASSLSDSVRPRPSIPDQSLSARSISLVAKGRIAMDDALYIRCLTFALSGAPPRTQTKRALLIGASALERVVRLLTRSILKYG